MSVSSAFMEIQVMSSLGREDNKVLFKGLVDCDVSAFEMFSPPTPPRLLYLVLLEGGSLSKIIVV